MACRSDSACYGSHRAALGQLEAKRQRLGMPLNTADGQIAATVLENGLTGVTRNLSDFRELGVKLFDPWDALNPIPQRPQANEPEPVDQGERAGELDR